MQNVKSQRRARRKPRHTRENISLASEQLDEVPTFLPLTVHSYYTIVGEDSPIPWGLRVILGRLRVKGSSGFVTPEYLESPLGGFEDCEGEGEPEGVVERQGCGTLVAANEEDCGDDGEGGEFVHCGPVWSGFPCSFL